MYKHSYLLLCLCLLLFGQSRFAFAYDRTTFPVRVYVNPNYTDKGKEDGKASSESVLALRQGVLDWGRLVVAKKNVSENEYALVVLDRSQTEEDSAALNRLGLFQLVDNKVDADLVIYPVNKRYLRSTEKQHLLGTYSETNDYRLGHIEVAIDVHDSLEIRSVVMHELGHALGLNHVSDEQCNLMSPALYVCFTESIPPCQNSTYAWHTSR